MKNKMEDYLGNIDDFREKIARMSIDWAGVAESAYVVLVWAERNNSVFLRHHKNEISGDNTYQIFQYKFPMFFWGDMPSALYIRKMRKGVFHLVDENGNFVKQIDWNVLTKVFVDDLLKNDYGDFNVRWNEFLAEFQKWLEDERDGK